MFMVPQLVRNQHCGPSWKCCDRVDKVLSCMPANTFPRKKQDPGLVAAISSLSLFKDGE